MAGLIGAVIVTALVLVVAIFAAVEIKRRGKK